MGIFCWMFGCKPNTRGGIRATTGRNCTCLICGQYIEDLPEGTVKVIKLEWSDMNVFSAEESFSIKDNTKIVRKIKDYQYTHVKLDDDLFKIVHGAFAMRIE